MQQAEVDEEDCNLHSEREEQGEGITSFFVARSRYLAFFGNLENPAIVLAIKHINERPSQAESNEIANEDVEMGEESEVEEARGQLASEEEPREQLASEEEARQELASREQLAREEEARQVLARKEAERQEVDRREREARDEQEEERRQDQARNGQEEEKPEELMPANLEEERGELSYQTEKRNTQIDLEGLLSSGDANEAILTNLNQTQGEQLQTRADSPENTQTRSVYEDESESYLDLEPHEDALFNSPGIGSSNEKESNNTIQIDFHLYSNKSWMHVKTLQVDPYDPSEIEQAAEEYIRDGLRVCNKRYRRLSPDICFQNITQDGGNTIFLIPKEVVFDDELFTSLVPLKRVGVVPMSSSPHKRRKLPIPSAQVPAPISNTHRALRKRNRQGIKFTSSALK